MKICAISDLHGYLDITIEKSDICIIAGDIFPLDIQVNDRKSKKWICGPFSEWAHALDCDKVVFIAGNHDFLCERKDDYMHELFPASDKVTYLNCEQYIFTSSDGQQLNIYGSPLSHKFGNWAFMDYEENLAETYKDIPYGVDILLTHDAPFGVSDVCVQSVFNNGEHIGSTALRDAIIEKNPKYNIHGHLHSSNHDCEMLNNTQVYNVSVKNEHYRPVYQPLYLNI